MQLATRAVPGVQVTTVRMGGNRPATQAPPAGSPVMDDPIGGTAGRAGRPSAAPPSGMSAADREMVGRLLAGEEAAFADLVKRYHGSLVRLAAVFVSGRDIAEEVAQETWLAVLTGLPSFEGRAALKTWIFQILTNRAKTRGLRDKRWVTFSPDDGDGEPAVDARRFTADGFWAEPPALWREATPETLLLGREARQAIERAIADLPPGQRAVVTLRDIEGLPSHEVSDLLQVSEGNQRVLLHRGRAKVRAAMERYLRAL